MNHNKAKELYLDYQNSVERLSESLKENINVNPFVLDATIQRFEFTFEIAWKLMREILFFRGKEVSSPRMAIKEGFKEKFFEDGDSWIKMLEDRNLTSHTYKKDLAEDIYKRIKDKHFRLLKELEKSMDNIFN